MGTHYKHFPPYFQKYLLAASLLVGSIALVACGGGGGSGGFSLGSSGSAGSISLVSITFPKTVELADFYDSAPEAAPLSQQIVFTFSGPVQGKVTSSSIQITSNPGLDYNGPLVLYDPDKNMIMAKGTFEIYSNMVVFTPQLPKKTLNLDDIHADLDSLPGLLPDKIYDIYIPIDSVGAIANLKGIDPGVKNPQSFKTMNNLQPNLFFSNFVQEPPKVVGTQPKNGRINFPVNNLQVMAGFEPFEEMRILFDQPLIPYSDQLEGADGNNDGIMEPNIFLRFSDRRLVVSTYFHKGVYRLNREHPDLGAGDTFKLTLEEEVGVALSDIAFDLKGNLIGLSKGKLYSMDFRTENSVIDLTLLYDTGYEELKGLARSLEGLYYSVDRSTGKLVEIDVSGQSTAKKGSIQDGVMARDLAFAIDGRMYLMRVEGEGTDYPVSHLDLVDADNASTQPLYSGMTGAYTSAEFINSRIVCLYRSDTQSIALLDVLNGTVQDVGDIPAPYNSGLDLAALFYDMETRLQIVENTSKGCTLSILPKGMLPYGYDLEIMVRNRLDNIRGWSLSDEDPDGSPAMAARRHAVFTTLDIGPNAVTDNFLEEFDDNVWESIDYELGEASAIWNFQDTDGSLPFYDNLLATFGLGGSGELGDFTPSGLFAYVILDTDYQPLPLLDGSTPGVLEPMVVTGGKFNFQKIHIPAGVNVSARGSNPLILTATDNVLIEGTIDISGLQGGRDDAFDSGFIPVPGGLGGPGAGRGGMGQPPIPSDFQAVTKLQSPPTGEHGYGPSNINQNGGRGGQTGASDGVPFKGAAQHQKSRGAGGGGGSMLWLGLPGKDGKGTYSPDLKENPIISDPPKGGEPGNAVFIDNNPDNNFFGRLGEIEEVHGGQGGGAAGSRWDSHNPNAANQTWAGMPNCMWDAKGGGGGGGGGALAISSLGNITVTKVGSIIARGGDGGGGEQVGVSNFGGAGGGGSGGVVILHSGAQITLGEENNPYPNPDYKWPEDVGAVIDVSGGMMGDAKAQVGVATSNVLDPCPRDPNDLKAQFCTLTPGDGGQGGYGVIQLMVDDPDNDIIPAPGDIAEAGVWVGARIFATDPLELHGGKALYMRHYLTYDPDPGAYPKEYQWGKDPADPDQKIYVYEPALVDPHKTIASLSPISHGLSNWIDFTGTLTRSDLIGYPIPRFLGFEGTDPDSGFVLTENGYVKNYQKPDFNDIVVDAPDEYLKNYIPEDNSVQVEFQGAHPVAPGLHVPDNDNMSDWVSDITSLSGYSLIRFRVKLNVSLSGELSLSNSRPQVNRVRIRAQY